MAKKTYSFLYEQAIVVKKYINEMLDKSFICLNNSPYATLVLIVKKFKKNF